MRRIIQGGATHLPKLGIVPFVRRLGSRLDERLVRLAVKFPIGPGLYYLLCSRAFRREQRAALWGRLKYDETLQRSGQNPYLLRRNIHRLEKGLIMRPRREVFATDYIEATVQCYAELCADRLGDARLSPQELQWAEDVLTSYFQIAGSHVAVERARKLFAECQARPTSGNGARRGPYSRDLSGPAPVSYTNFLDLAHRRRSVRWFLPIPVSRELIDQAIEAASLSPSACNRQPYHFRLFDDPALVQTMASIPMGTKGFSHNFPAVAVLIGRQRAYFSERDRHVIYIDASLAAMSFVLALETLGLSSCCINWPDIEPREKQMAAQLALEPDERPVMLIAIGHPDPTGDVPYSQKRSLDDIRKYY